METTVFEQNILDLNFSFLDKSGEGGVLLTYNYKNLDANLASPDILFALETAKCKFNADAVYFRYFQDGRVAVPQLYIFDYTEKTLSNEERNRIHIQMWNGYQVPVYIIIEKTSVGVFDSRAKPDEDKSNYVSEIITLTGETIKSFNAQGFNDGLFWEEQDEKKHFQFEQSAARDLIRGLKEVYKSFQEKSGLNRHVALKLLVQSLLIKYLEERDEDSESGYFAGTYFQKHFRCQNFCAVIRKGKLLDLLDQLAKDFNGKIFEWDKEEETEEREAIKKTGVEQLADYLDGNIRNRQFVFWRLYSFSHLPVEVLSSVYEELLTDSKDIVYTPEMIVSTLVDECMPLKSPMQDYKLIDVSCGSGIFLVKTYKRIVQWWRYEQWRKTGELKKPTLSVLKELLLKSIHGIDTQQDAIRLSIFSLALAILDEVNLDPPTWGKLKFPDLSNNIITQDFFRYLTNMSDVKFNLVIGNPPFNPPTAETGESQSNGQYFADLKEKFGYSSEVRIPNQNVALHFLIQSLKILKKDGLLCLIQPSGPLIYQNETAFKQEIFSKNNLLQVIDFTKLADKIWGRKNVATVAVFIQKSIPDNKNVLHIIANRTFSNTNRLFLEFDHYDFYSVSKESAIQNPNVWKSNLLGGRRVNELVDRLKSYDTLGDYLKIKEKQGWVIGVGFKVKGQKNQADYITGQNYIPVVALTENGIDFNRMGPCHIEYFDRPRKKEIYTQPHILIREIIGQRKIPIAFSSEYLTFPIGIVSIHAPQEDLEELKILYEYLNQNNEFLRVYIIVTSGRMMIGKATSISKEDLMTIPYPHHRLNLTFSESEHILINDIINSKQTGIENSKVVNEIQIQEFSKIFCRTLNSVYESDDKSFQLYKVLDAGKYYALHFEYKEGNLKHEFEITEDLEQYINQIISSNHENKKAFHIQRIIKVYGQDCVVLAKPKKYGYWMPSIALRDADETFTDYVKARYQNA